MAGAPPHANECLLNGFFGVLFGAEDAQSEGETLPMVAIVEDAERRVVTFADGSDEVCVIGETVVVHIHPVSNTSNTSRAPDLITGSSVADRRRREWDPRW